MKRKLEKLPQKITSYVGSIGSIFVHTFLFIGIFALRFFGISISDILLILTTLVSLEAIYLSIFIQITINKQQKELEGVSEDIEDIQESVEEIQESVEEIQNE